MQVILLEKIGNRGNIGSVVGVKDGFARNYLLPRNKAIRATKSNLELFEKRRAELEKQNAERKAAAEQLVTKVNGMNIILIRQAGEDGRLYGSVTSRDVARLISEKCQHEITSESVIISVKIKETGIYSAEVVLHPEVKAHVSLTVARSEAEAKASVGKKAKKAEDDTESSEPKKGKQANLAAKAQVEKDAEPSE